jgi:DNA-binding XRE family transcriptional regulator
MARSLKDFIAALPADEQAEIETRYQGLRQEVEGLRELRQIAGKAQEDIASALNIKQPSVSKIEKQADMYLLNSR